MKLFLGFVSLRCDFALRYYVWVVEMRTVVAICPTCRIKL